jgi:hypothetical protein
MTGPKIVTLDIETSPLQSMHWRLWKENIGLNQIGDEWTVLSFCAKWLGKRDVIYEDVSQQENFRDDSELLAKLWEILHEADFVIAQNGKGFDLKKIRARMVMHGMPPFSPVTVIDTMLIAKEVFGFTSNRLEWLSTHLSKIKKLKHNRFPGFDLWVQCLNGNPAAWAEMRRYNIVDVKSTEQVYLSLRPWSVGHPNVAAYWPDEDARCPKCGSKDLQKRGHTFTQTGQYHRYCCGNCGGWSRSRYTINTLGKRRALLSN